MVKASEEMPPKDPNAMREVKYVVTPEGLKIEVAGVRQAALASLRPLYDPKQERIRR